MAENINYAKGSALAHEQEKDRPKTQEGHLALFINLAEPEFVEEFHQRVIRFANNYDATNKYPESQRSA